MDFEQSQEFGEFAEFCRQRGSLIIAEEMTQQLDEIIALPDAERLSRMLEIVESGFRSSFEAFRSDASSSNSLGFQEDPLLPGPNNASVDVEASVIEFSDDLPSFTPGEGLEADTQYIQGETHLQELPFGTISSHGTEIAHLSRPPRRSEANVVDIDHWGIGGIDPCFRENQVNWEAGNDLEDSALFSNLPLEGMLGMGDANHPYNGTTG